MEDTSLLLKKIVAVLAMELKEAYAVPEWEPTERHPALDIPTREAREQMSLQFQAGSLAVIQGFVPQCIDIIVW